MCVKTPQSTLFFLVPYLYQNNWDFRWVLGPEMRGYDLFQDDLDPFLRIW